MDEKRLKDVCVCESEGCGDKQLKHFEQCAVCGSSAYHKTIKVYVEEGGNKQDVYK